jgi:ferredoxin-NADP reductase
LKHALLHHQKLRHTFIYSNRVWEDVIFRDELARLEAVNPDRLKVVHTLTRENKAEMRYGRVNAELIRECVQDLEEARFYLCGPAISTWDRAAAKEAGVEPQPRFLETVFAALDSLGVKRNQITRESYG